MRRPWPKVQTTLQKRILRAFVTRGLLESSDAKDMQGYKHSGFSVDAGVCIEATTALRWSVCCAIAPVHPFAMERLQGRQRVDLPLRQAAQRTPQRLPMTDVVPGQTSCTTPLELIDRYCRPGTPPRTHRHRYFGVLAPNSPLRDVVTAMAQALAQVAAVPADPATTGNCSQSPRSMAMLVTASRTTPRPEPPPPPKRPAHYLWAVLIARIYEVFRLVPDLRRADAHHRLYHAQRRNPAHPGPSGQIPSHRTSRQHVGRHCGMNSMRNR